MSEAQRRELDRLLRESPLDVGGDVDEQRQIFDQIMASSRLPAGVRTSPGALGEIPVIEIVNDAAETGVVLFLHGGAYAIGSATAAIPLAAEIASRAHVRVSAVDYRLAPEHPYPAAIAIVGESAGGGLTLSLLLAIRASGQTLPSAAAVFSPWMDLDVSGESATTKRPWIPLSRQPDYAAGQGTISAAWTSPPPSPTPSMPT